jgi:predicted CXXCH cytochrome family protein
MRAQHRGLFVSAKRTGRDSIIHTIIFLAGSLLATATASAQPADKPADNPNTAHYTGEGAAACLFCHDVERMRLIGKTPHGDKNNPDSPFAKQACESCHGPGSLHTSRSRRGHGRPPMIDFGVNTSTSPARQSQSCLTNCHEKKMGPLYGIQWKGSAHGSPWKGATGKVHQMSCSNCHEVHTEHDPMEDKQSQAKICYSCHQKAENKHQRLKDKFEKLSCWDCHDVH